jgi:hypothetical protein
VLRQDARADVHDRGAHGRRADVDDEHAFRHVVTT